MRNPYLRLRVAALLLLLFTLCATHTTLFQAATSAQQQSSGIDTYAITGARIVTVSGPTIERGTVLIRDGLIVAVGADVSAPADARIIDGAGLTVYPGLIDSNTSLGIPPPPPKSSGAASRPGASTQAAAAANFTSPNSTQPPGLQPELLAADQIRAGGEQIESARSAGVTAALSAPREGILIGQSALINLAGETPQQMIVRSPVALHVGFTPLRTGSYPASLMGVFSALRQMMLDAERYAEAQAIYERGPRGIRRPEQDKSLAALIPAITRRMPVVMYANTEREIRRALDLAKEFNLRAVIAGGEESWKVTDRLRQTDVPVLLSLNYPKRTTAEVPEADRDPLRVLRARVDAPKTAGRLAAARVRFAFQSGSLPTMADFIANAAKAVENGLPREEAVRALTLRPAEILGVADRLGTIEAGKIANLTVVRGDLFDRRMRISHVFIDGRPVDLKPVTPSGASGIASGTWTLSVNLGEGEQAVTLTLQQEGEVLRGSLQGALGSAQIANASVGAGGDIRFSAPVNVGGLTTEATFTGTITGNEMRGTITVVGRAPGSFTGTRPAGPPPAATPSPTPPRTTTTPPPASAATPPPPPASTGTPPPPASEATPTPSIPPLTVAARLSGEAQFDASHAPGREQQQPLPSARGLASQEDIVIRHATILTASHGTLQDSDILIRRGKIAAVGRNLDAPRGARVIDATGKFVTPGIIDCHSHTMIDAVNELTYSVTSMVRISDVLNPTDVAIYRELAGGVTTANLLHGSGNAIGGQNTVVKIKYGRPAEDFIFPGAPPGIKFALGENPKRSHFPPIPGQPPRYPSTRMGVEEVIRDAMVRARDYKKSWDEYRAAIARGEKNLIRPRRDLQLEPLVEVLEGKRLVHAHSYRSDEMLMLINLANEFGFKVRTFQHALEGYKIAREIAQHGAGASIFADSWGYKIEAYDAIPYNGAIMTRAGVNVSVNSDSNELARRLNIDAAKLMKYGDLTEEEALRTITLNPAWQLGIDGRVGSIDVGKDADIVIWNGHPFSVYSRVETTLIDGEVFFDRQQDLARRQELERERATLERAEVNRPPAKEATTPPAPPRDRSRTGEMDDAESDEGDNQR